MARKARIILVREVLEAESDVLMMDSPLLVNHPPLPFSCFEKGRTENDYGKTNTNSSRNLAAGYFLSGYRILEI
jgi:hypothetical protein